MRLTIIVRTLVWLLAVLSVQASGTDIPHNAQVKTYVLWVGGHAAGRAEHEARNIRKALQRTESSYGPFELIVSHDLSIAGQWRQLLAEGEQIQMASTTLMDFPLGEITLIPVPIAGGKLGYRNLVVRKQRLAEFSKVKGVEQLANFTAGQGSSWPDMWVYEANNLPIVGGDSMAELLRMLTQDEIDYVPLGVEETPGVLAAHPKLSAGLAIVPHLYIYYPLSSFPVVSSKRPELIERLRTGLESMHADGSLGGTGRDALTQEQLASCSVITLENPSRLFPLR